MSTIKTYKFKLKPNKEQEETLFHYLNTTRFIYNLCLDYKKNLYQNHNISISKNDIQKELKDIKNETDWIGSLHSQVIQEVTDRLFVSYDNFFRRVKKGETPGFPKFAKKDYWSSFKFKVKNLYTSPKMTQNSCLNVKNIKKPNNSKNLDKYNKYSIEKLAFFSSLFFLFIFSSNPNFTKIFNFSGALASKFSKKNLVQKLSQVPVFAVTNATGQPYLANNSNGEQVGLIFFSQEDALAMLKSMQKTHQALEARIYIMGLDKAYRMVLSNASPSGIRGNLGQELKMIFRFYPDQKQVKNANALKKSLNPIESFKGIPVFIADGLTIRKGREEIVPVF